MSSRILVPAHRGAVAALVAFAAVAACTEQSAGPAPPDLALQAAERGCPAADVIVSTYDELWNAVANSAPGTTIGVSGTIPVQSDIWLQTERLTLTCAAPGAGLSVAEGATIDFLVRPSAPDVAVVGLALDASGTKGGAIFAHWDGVVVFAERVRVVGNRARCGLDECITFLAGDQEFSVMTGAVVVGNRVDAVGSRVGIHVQGFRDAVVERNDVRTVVPGPAVGIEVNLSRDVVVRDNVVTGPWTDGIFLFNNVVAARLTGNQVSGALDNPIVLFSTDSVQVTDNIVECGASSCAFLADGATNALVARNVFQAAGPATGVHVQQGTDGTRILDNRIVTSGPSTNPAFGGIRIRDGAGVIVAGNRVEGPWANGIASDFISNATIRRNRLLRPAGLGLSLALDGSAITQNGVVEAGGGGLLLRSGCFNTIAGNALAGNEPGAVFEAPTGANTYQGDAASVVDLGNFDCDGDGVPDPNVIVTTGARTSAVAARVPPTSGKIASGPRGLR